MGLQRTHSYPCNVTEHDALEHIHFFNKTFSPSFLFFSSTICLLLGVGALRLLFRETTIFWEVESCVEHSVTLRTQYAFMTETMTPFLHPEKITEHRTSSSSRYCSSENKTVPSILNVPLPLQGVGRLHRSILLKDNIRFYRPNTFHPKNHKSKWNFLGCQLIRKSKSSRF